MTTWIKQSNQVTPVDEILEQFNTSRYIPSDFSAANGTQYTINADGEYTEDVWLKMATGQTLTVTYNNLNGNIIQWYSS